ncbi:MAG: DUF3048 domain-containing protein [bacterium]|nr:DUF3048 domain-containing protein [bacterium]
MQKKNNKIIKKRVAGAAFILAIAVCILFWFFLWQWDGESRGASLLKQNKRDAIQYPSRLNGEETGTATTSLPVSIMIDNHPNAYPQSGLADARVVYEVPVEGGITRYMAMFDSSQVVAKVGPVRSARPYYLDWAAEYGAPLYMHCGGSPQALRQIIEKDVFDANQFYNDPYFWRDNGRDAPYNLYTSTSLWSDYISNKKSDNSVVAWDSWNFSSDCAMASSTYVAGVKLTYNPDYNVSWRYNTETDVYDRSVNGELHLDENPAPGGPALGGITAGNVVIQFVKVKVIDEIGRREVGAVGTGDAMFIRCGKIVNVIWKKPTLADRTRFYDIDGKEINFSPGKIWIEVAPIGAKVSLLEHV